MAQAPVAAVIGLRALNRDLNKLVTDRGPLNKAMSQAGRTAAEPVAGAARGALPQDTGRLAGDVRVNATRSGATVRMGRSSIRYAGWVEFGGHRGAPHDSQRDYLPNGRFLFPNARQLAGTVLARYTDALQSALDAYPWENEATSGDQVHD
jgi:uncharacterized protein YfaQ (DUF2300 family)